MDDASRGSGTPVGPAGDDAAAGCPESAVSGSAEPAAREQRRPARPGCLRRFLIALLVLVGALALWIGYEALSWPDVGKLARSNPKTTRYIELYKARQRRSGRPAAPAWIWVADRSISSDLKRAVLVGEDINFFSHHGFDVGEIRNAIDEAWDEKTLPRGASTITQQLARNLWLSPARDPIRKLKEALLTRQLERSLSKRRILEIYLNVAEFGPGVYGAEAASRRWFGKPASALSEREAAELAAGLPMPSRWHPGSTSRAYQRRVEKLLRRMEKASFLRSAVR